MRGLDTLDSPSRHPKRAGLGPKHHIGANRLRPALRRERFEWADVEHASHVSVRFVGDEHPVRRRQVFEPDAMFTVSPIAVNSRVVATSPSTTAPVQMPTRIDERSTRRRAEVGDRALECQPRPHRLLGIVLVRRFGTPQCHDGIADVLVDPTAERRDDVIESRPHLVHEVADDLCVHDFGERGEPWRSVNNTVACDAAGPPNPAAQLARSDATVRSTISSSTTPAKLLLRCDCTLSCSRSSTSPVLFASESRAGRDVQRATCRRADPCS